MDALQADSLRDTLRARGQAAGLTAVGFTHARPFDEARVTLIERKSRGLHGGMQFTYRNPERSTTPTRILETAESLIVGAMAYAAPTDADTAPGRPQAEIAAYAWRDHYGALKQALAAMAAPLIEAGYQARVVADDNALVDRAAALRAGIGWAGKNSNLLVPGHGSWFVLGAVVTNAPLDHDTAIEPACGPCRRCIDRCPTDAIIADGVVDARRCLAWLLQAGGDFPLEFRKALGTRIYGCDDCQVVCPPSNNTEVDLIGDEVTSLDLLGLLTCSDEQLLADVGRWYIPKRDLRYVRRNALVALGNATLTPEVRAEAASVLRSYLGRSEREDSADGGDAADRDNNADMAGNGDVKNHVEPDAMLARHAQWAANELGLVIANQAEPV